MRKPFIAGNWKMHKTIEEAVELAKELVENLQGIDKKIMIAPPFTALYAVSSVVRETNILLGAQNMASVTQGAHTGEVSVLMLKDIDVSHIILGHSERRHVYGEVSEFINQKVKLSLANSVNVILCVGETEQEREKGITEQIVETQIRDGLKGVSNLDMESVTIAYEPVWAIGTGKTATPHDADMIHKYIRKLIKEIYTEQIAESLVIQYGGSVKPENIKELMAMENIDGALVGGASLVPEKFIPIVQYNKN